MLILDMFKSPHFASFNHVIYFLCMFQFYSKHEHKMEGQIYNSMLDIIKSSNLWMVVEPILFYLSRINYL